VNEANTNTQAGQDTQSLQPGGNQTQGNASPLQTGSGAGLSGNDSSDILNQGAPAGSLSVGVAGSSSQTSIAPVEPVVLKDSGVPVFYVFIPLILFFFALFLAYRRIRKLDKTALESTQTEEESLEDVTWVTKDKKKKKKKKPKKAHHH
jgi:hypothetical protein